MKRFLNFCLSILFLMILVTACAPTVNYVGKKYPASNQLEIFYSKDDVKKKFETMGHAEAKSALKSAEGCQKKLEETAKKYGADAVIIEDLGSSVQISGTQGNTSSYDSHVVKATFIKYQ